MAIRGLISFGALAWARRNSASAEARSPPWRVVSAILSNCPAWLLLLSLVISFGVGTCPEQPATTTARIRTIERFFRKARAIELDKVERQVLNRNPICIVHSLYGHLCHVMIHGNQRKRLKFVLSRLRKHSFYVQNSTVMQIIFGRYLSDQIISGTDPSD